MKTKHTEEHCGTDKCPRCKAVYEMLQRFQIQQTPNRFTELYQLVEHAVELEEASIGYNVRYALGKTTVSVPIKKVELYPENFVAAVTKCEAFLLDDNQLEETLKAGAYRGHQYRIYLDTFVCTREQQEIQVHGGGHSHTVKGVANFPARAAKVGVELPEGYSEDVVETVFAGNLHLAVFTNKEFIWAVKNLALTDAPYETVTKDTLHLNAPAFLATGIIDKQGDTGRPRVSAVEVND